MKDLACQYWKVCRMVVFQSFFSSYYAATDIIEDGINGCLVDPFDIDLYAEKLYKLASDPALLNRMQAFAVQSAKQFSIEIIGHKWINLFQTI